MPIPSRLLIYRTGRYLNNARVSSIYHAGVTYSRHNQNSEKHHQDKRRVLKGFSGKMITSIKHVSLDRRPVDNDFLLLASRMTLLKKVTFHFFGSAQEEKKLQAKQFQRVIRKFYKMSKRITTINIAITRNSFSHSTCLKALPLLRSLHNIRLWLHYIPVQTNKALITQLYNLSKRKAWPQIKSYVLAMRVRNNAGAWDNPNITATSLVQILNRVSQIEAPVPVKTSLTLDLTDKDGDIIVKNISNALKKLKHMASFTIQNEPSLDYSALINATRESEPLRQVICLQNLCNDNDNKSLITLAESLPLMKRLRSLKLMFVMVQNLDKLSILFESIRHLNKLESLKVDLTDVRYLEDKILESLALSLASLLSIQSLNIKLNNDVSNERISLHSLERIILTLKEMTYMRKLKVHFPCYKRIYMEGLAAIDDKNSEDKQINRLTEEAGMVNTRQFTLPAVIDELKLLENLEINLGFQSFLEPAEILSLLVSLSSIRHLTELVLICSIEVIDEDLLMALKTAIGSLKSLNTLQIDIRSLNPIRPNVGAFVDNLTKMLNKRMITNIVLERVSV